MDSKASTKPSADTSQQHLAPVVGVLSSLVKEVHNLSSAISSLKNYEPNDHHHETNDTSSPNARSHKRKRTADDATRVVDTAPSLRSFSEAGTTNIDTPNSLDDSSVNDTLDCYFFFIQPWLSILHEPSFREEFQTRAGNERLGTIFQAMVVATQRFIRKDGRPLPYHVQAEQMAKARRHILLTAADDICLANLQALMILTYTDIADDNPQRACSLLGMVAKHIEYLQLSWEDPNQSDHGGGIFRRPSKIPAPPTEWVEEEERRRVFWNAFLLDRFYAAITGCNPSLSGADINRKLPACASFWHTNQPRMTPYLRVSDKSTARLNYPIDLKQQSSSLEAELPKDTRTATHDGYSTPSSGVGSLAFYLESVESMSMVISHVLQQSVDFNNRNDISRWLARFKEVDLCLMRWKMRLPQQWMDSGVFRNILPGVMDPAMTVANSTHNTCLILLHEQIAYPDAELDWIRLPRLSSAEICVRAAIEVCTIVRKFLEQSGVRFPLPPQLGLCAFVSASTLLRHWRYHSAPLAQEFWLLVCSLDDMSRRWQQTPTPAAESRTKQRPTACIFSRFAERLRAVHARCELDPSYRIDKTEPLYEAKLEATSRRPTATALHCIVPEELPTYIAQKSKSASAAASGKTGPPLPPVIVGNNNPPFPLVEGERTTISHSHSHESRDLDSRYNADTQQWGGRGGMANNVQPQPQPEDEEEGLNEAADLLAISQALTVQDFTSMDRIVSFDEMMLSGISEAMNWD
ncbi:hypothetical protein ACEPPN_015094 [Leptodophora sp. 'Broadleaf-Isolate-01']